MPRLSVFSWDGLDNDDASSELQETQNRMRSYKVGSHLNVIASKKGRRTELSRHMVRALFRPSVVLLDKTPAPPSDLNPLQRCLNPRWKTSAMQLHLRIMAMSEKRDLTQQEIMRHTSQTNHFTSFPYNPGTKEGFYVERTGTVLPYISPRNCATPDRIWLRNLQLSDFRPLQAPFVPDLIRILANAIEKDCRSTTFSLFFDHLRPLRVQARKQAAYLVRISHDKKQLHKTINSLSNPVRMATLRMFLSALQVKPLHLSKAVLKQIIKRPLYDQFLRPNPHIKTLVRQIALPKTRTELDTLAFLMTHIINAWEASPVVPMGRTTLSDIYGPLLISFSERPIIIDRDVSPNKTEEAALMEVILDVCDAPFWNHLSMLQIHKAFQKTDQSVPVGDDTRLVILYIR
ncbi:unnamed protein product [Echinostoma caproni]|uniref:Rho-GAP domain-containing protein n=1 Tax=Echinostoma caproni TaxID=27848 RepID=A0A183A017_9TREM|nr:unnamed protein product [Echinostoma caproni]